MKKLIFIIITLFFSLNIFVNSYATPPEFSSICGTTEFSFKDLEYYEEKELIEGYCSCNLTIDLANKLFALHIKWMPMYRSGSQEYRDTMNKIKQK